MYSALMIDLKKSRSYPTQEREALQNYIIEAYQLLNRVYKNGIVRGVEFSAGDEIQGLFSEAITAYLYYRMFAMLVHPVRIRAGIGLGSWDIQIENKGTTAQDGQAYHHARKAINEVANQDGYSTLLFSGSRIDEVVNSLIGATDGLCNRMSTYQNELMILTELLYPITLGDYANHYALLDAVRLIQGKSLLASSHKKIKDSILLNRIGNTRLDLIEPIDIGKEESSFYVTIGKTRGIPTNLSAILQISRQSIDRTLKSANIYSARNLTISTLRIMAQMR